MKIRLSCDDGCASDVRVAELAEKYDIECIFYWPVEWSSLAFDNGYQPLSYEQALAIADKFEVGSHTITHRHLTKIPYSDALKEIYDSKQMLENLLDIDISKFAPPRGYTNEELTKFTLTYYESQRLTRGKHLVHIHPDSGANGNIPWREYYELNKDTIKEAWLHSWELDRYPDEWDNLEQFLKEQNERS